LRVLKEIILKCEADAIIASSQDDPLRVLKVFLILTKPSGFKSFIPGRPVEGTESSPGRPTSPLRCGSFIPGRPVEGTESWDGGPDWPGRLAASSQDDPLRVLKEVAVTRGAVLLLASSQDDPLRVLKEGIDTLVAKRANASSQDDPLRVLKVEDGHVGRRRSAVLHPRTTR